MAQIHNQPPSPKPPDWAAPPAPQPQTPQGQQPYQPAYQAKTTHVWQWNMLPLWVKLLVSFFLVFCLLGSVYFVTFIQMQFRLEQSNQRYQDLIDRFGNPGR